MKLYFNQLSGALSKSLAPIYLIAGDEPLQKMEAADMIRDAARKHGYADRQLFFADQGFDWGILASAVSNFSLFSDKQFFEMIVFTDKLKKDSKEFLQNFAQQPAENTVLVLRMNKIDARETWVKRISDVGVLVQVYLKEGHEMSAWLRERMLKIGLKMEDQVVELIAERVAGNMLAAAQEVDRLKLLYADQIVRLEDAETAVCDNSKYNVYDLASAASIGDSKNALRILQGLQDEGCASSLVLWSLTAQIRKLAALETRVAQGDNLDTLLRKEWRNKRDIFRKSLLRKPKIHWQRLLYWCGEADKAAKGLSSDDVWHHLSKLTLRICGVRVLSELGNK